MGADYDEGYSDTESTQTQSPQSPPINHKTQTDDALAIQSKAQNLETEEPVKKKKKRKKKSKKNKNVRQEAGDMASGAVLTP